MRPTPMGGHNWQPMAYSKETGYVYIPVLEETWFATNDPDWDYQSGIWNTGINFGGGTTTVESEGALLAWDPVNQREVWRIPLTHRWNSGILTTAGNLVFQGGGDGRFVAYDALSGEVLWEVTVGLGIIGSPVTYMIDGEQYVSVAAGGVV